VRACDDNAKAVCDDYITDMKRRFEDRGPEQDGISVMDVLFALELADPTSPRDITEHTWRAVHGLSLRYKLDYDTVRKEIEEARKICSGAYDGERLDAADTAMCKANLLNFFKGVFGDKFGPETPAPDGDGHTARERLERLGTFAMFGKAVFTVLIASSVVESLFSKYAFLKSKQRASMKDETVAQILLVQQLNEIIKDPSKAFTGELLELGEDLSALDDRLTW
jgi:hypothetical protein